MLTFLQVDYLYQNNVDDIFTKYPWYKRLQPSCPRYDNKHFKKVLKEVFGDAKMTDLKKPCYIAAWRTNGPNNNKVFDHTDDVLIRDVVLASASAPTYFDTHTIGDTEYMDGGLWSNNPALCAVSGCGEDLENIKLLSLVTGGTQECNKTGNMGLLSLAKYLGSKLITGRVTGTDYFVRKLVKDSLTICPEVKEDYGLDDVENVHRIRRIWELEYSNSNKDLNKFLKNI